MIATATPPETPLPSFSTGLTPWAQTLPQHISPTAAKSYLSCSLKFYFKRVACIRKKTPASLHLGKAEHAALQSFHLARWRGLGIFLTETPPTVAPKHLLRPLSPATPFPALQSGLGRRGAAKTPPMALP